MAKSPVVFFVLVMKQASHQLLFMLIMMQIKMEYVLKLIKDQIIIRMIKIKIIIKKKIIFWRGAAWRAPMKQQRGCRYL